MLQRGLARTIATPTGVRFGTGVAGDIQDRRAWNEHVAREFDRIVQPTPEQGSRIQARLDSAVKELQDIRLDTIARSTNVIWRLIADVGKKLTPEQLKAFEQMKPRPADLTLDLLQVRPQKEGTNSPNK